MNIEMTGRQDREGPWKIAIAGFPGAGKTLMASTAPKPLFVFFQDNPRLKSIADRHIPHVKMTNEQTSGGWVTVQDKLNALTMNLSLKEHDYSTLVIDTGDELFQAMKAARRAKNSGEFNVGDWGWIADAYREVVTGLIDLDMDVVILYHLKNSQDGEDGFITRELMLQGSSTNEAPGWFDVIGALDTFASANEEGDTVTKRVLLTHSSRLYPWVKDHSGALPTRYPISDNFVGDMTQLLELLHAGDDLAEREVLEEIETAPVTETVSGAAVPTPADLQAKKTEVMAENPDNATEKEPEPEAIPAEPEAPHEDESAEDGPDEPSEETSSNAEQEGQDEEPTVTDEKAEEEVILQIGAEAVHVCAVCQKEVKDTDLLELTRIRFRQDLCREHFKDKIEALRAS